jgi:hypothetical protein
VILALPWEPLTVDDAVGAIETKAIVLAQIDQLNVLFAELRAPLSAITPAQAIAGGCSTESTLKIDHLELRRRLRSETPWQNETTDVDGNRIVRPKEVFDDNPSCWSRFVEVAAEGVLEDFANGELDIDGALQAIRRCARACEPAEEETAVSHLLNRLIRISPKVLNRRRPEIPTRVKCVATTLLRLLDEESPGQLAPGHHGEWTSPTLNAALDWFVTLGVFDAETLITAKTLYSWFKAAGHVAASRRSS